MSKKLFVLLLAAMFMTTIAIVVLTVTGHEDIVRAAGAWVTNSIESVVGILGVVGILVVVALLT
jgi:hypothetical protein